MGEPSVGPSNEAGPRDIDSVRREVAYWCLLETLNFQQVPAFERITVSDFWSTLSKGALTVRNVETDADFPWLQPEFPLREVIGDVPLDPRKKKDSPKEARWAHTVYVGVVDTSTIVDPLIEQLIDAEDTEDTERAARAKRPRETCAFALRVTPCGFFVTEEVEGRERPQFKDDSIAFSSLPWGLSRIAEFLATGRLAELKYQHLVRESTAAVSRYVDESAKAIEEQTGVRNAKVPVTIENLVLLLEIWLRATEYAARPLANWAPVIRVRSRQLHLRKNRDADDYSAPLLNSFLFDDVAMVAGALDRPAGPKLGRALKAYLSAPHRPGPLPAAQDLGSTPRLVDWIEPGKWSPSAWPQQHGSLALAQQCAVNVIRSQIDVTGVVAVNGPPGTGKTTLLTDVVADSVFQRALRLAHCARVHDAFIDGSSDDRPRVLHPDFQQYGIIVASTNNCAVENVSRALPDRSKLPNRWGGEGGAPDLAYFRSVSEALFRPQQKAPPDPADSDSAFEEEEDPAVEEMKEEPIQPWGLSAVVLGRRANCQKAATALWFSEESLRANMKDAKGRLRVLEFSAAKDEFFRAMDRESAERARVQRTSESIGALPGLTRAIGRLKENRGALATRAAGERTRAAEAEKIRDEAGRRVSQLTEARALLRAIDDCASAHHLRAANLELAASTLVRRDEAIRKAEKARTDAAKLTMERDHLAREELDLVAAEPGWIFRLLHFVGVTRHRDWVAQIGRVRVAATSAETRLKIAESTGAAAEREELDHRAKIDECRKEAPVLQARLDQAGARVAALAASVAAGDQVLGFIDSTDRAAIARQRGAIEQEWLACVRRRDEAAEGARDALKEAARLYGVIAETDRELALKSREESQLRDIRDEALQKRPWLGEGACRMPLDDLQTLVPRDEEVFQKSSPNADPDWMRAREAVFAASLQLCESFVHESWESGLKYLLNQCVDVLCGSDVSEIRESVLHSSWAALFMVTPVVSTTFASAGRMLRGCGPESLGLLIVDEAGQAVPQAILGSLYRARRAVVVGDPMQIPPVVSAPKKLVVGLCRQLVRVPTCVADPECGRKANCLEYTMSVQTRADTISPMGAVIKGQRVGCPLRVHRRCESPMFELSRELSYDKKFVTATLPASEPWERLDLIGESAWLDSGPCDKFREHFVEWEARIAMRIVQRLQDHGHGKRVFVITPFKSVADGLRNSLLPLGAAFCKTRVGTVHTFQGREADCVLWVLGGNVARPGARKWAASPPNLMNVALTRAKRKVIIIGNREFWAVHPHFNQVIGALNGFGKVVPVRTAAELDGWIRRLPAPAQNPEAT